MTIRTELVVLGAGPAGIAAATTAARHGVHTWIIDAGPAAGGQVYRPLPGEFRIEDGAALGPDHATGERLRRELHESSVETAFATPVWSVAPGFLVDASGREGPRAWEARALVAATGTHERVIPMSGWTLPGVVGLGAATVLLKAERMLPGETTLVAGSGPLVAAVAAGIVKGGGRVAAMVDLARPGDWPRHSSRHGVAS